MLLLMESMPLPLFGVDLAAGEAKEKDRALNGEAPINEGLAVGTTVRVVVVERYQGLRESKWETVKEKRDDVDPLPDLAVAGSKRREVVLGYDANVLSSSEFSKSREDTRVVTAESSTNGRTPCKNYNTTLSSLSH